jgi:hypothetical protein
VNKLFSATKQKMKSFETLFWSGQVLDDLYERVKILYLLFLLVHGVNVKKVIIRTIKNMTPLGLVTKKEIWLDVSFPK